MAAVAGADVGNGKSHSSTDDYTLQVINYCGGLARQKRRHSLSLAWSLSSDVTAIRRKLTQRGLHVIGEGFVDRDKARDNHSNCPTFNQVVGHMVRYKTVICATIIFQEFLADSRSVNS